MARASRDEDIDERPLDPAVEKVRRKLVRFVAINLGLLFIALMAVVGAVVYKSRTTELPATTAGDIPAPAEAIEAVIALPQGTSIVAHSLSGNRISIDARLADGTRTIFVYDIGEGRMIGRYTVTR
jgi:hypothetical protein